MILAFKPQFREKILDGTKIHTIRDDPKKRWSQGKKIHCATGVRTGKYNCFFETKCISTQRILMTYSYNDIIEISVGGKQLLGWQERLRFAKNDGFEKWSDFFNWFYPLIQESEDETYLGRLIHWTKKRY